MEADGSGANVSAGTILNDFAEAVLAREETSIASTRQNIIDELGEAALADAAAVIAGFNLVTRVADATGLPLEDYKEEASVDLREQLGLNALAANK